MAWQNSVAPLYFLGILACRRRLLEGLDLTSTSLGLLINLVEHDSGCRPHLAALPLRHGMRALPLLCRLMQVRTSFHLSLYVD